MDQLSDVVSFITNPAVWLIALAVWFLTWGLDFYVPQKVKTGNFDKVTAKPGDLYSDGNDATSKVEQRVRADIEKMGFALYPGSTAVVTYPDERGKVHKYTPDIIVKSRKVIVEVDPLFTHGGPDKEKDDRRRGLSYQNLGYGVVRFRLGKDLNRLGKYDVVSDREDYNREKWEDQIKEYNALKKAIQKAKPEI